MPSSHLRLRGSQFYFVNYLHLTCGGGHPVGRIATGTRHVSLKATWQLDGKQCTDAMSHLVTLCKGRHLALVDELLDLPSFSMSLGTLALSVCDSEARSLDNTPSFTPCPRSRHALLHITGA